MRYEITDEFKRINETSGIMHNMHLDSCMEIVAAATKPEPGTGVLLAPGEKLRFAAQEGEGVYVRYTSQGQTGAALAVANFKPPASSGGGAGGNVSGGGAGGCPSYRQITKLGVTATAAAPKVLEQAVAITTTFCKPPLEILKFVPGAQDVVTTVCAFDNADADDFMVGGVAGEAAPTIVFDGAMHPRTIYGELKGEATALGDGRLRESDWIDVAGLASIEQLDLRSGCKLVAVPKPALVVPQGLIPLVGIEGIDQATLTGTFSGGGACRVLVTTDLAIYKTYRGGAWEAIDHTDPAAVKTSGISAAELADIDRAAWDALTAGQSGVGFAYLPTIAQSSDTCAVDRLDLKVDMRGSWSKAAHGADYQYGYPRNDTLRVSLMSDGSFKINYAG